MVISTNSEGRQNLITISINEGRISCLPILTKFSGILSETLVLTIKDFFLVVKYCEYRKLCFKNRIG